MLTTCAMNTGQLITTTSWAAKDNALKLVGLPWTPSPAPSPRSILHSVQEIAQSPISHACLAKTATSPALLHLAWLLPARASATSAHSPMVAGGETSCIACAGVHGVDFKIYRSDASRYQVRREQAMLLLFKRIAAI
eukprot:95582-Amphidinium_carterae.1